jgi:RNA polymerase sigma factor (sigma-70 family)
MITNGMMNTDGHSDAELVSRSLAGDRDAFSHIVSRYQTLICSLAYSRIGNLGQSEDVAQETFITAWKHLRLLREPAKLRAWLCGIVRNRIHKNLRREGREPAHDAEPLELLHESPAGEALPSDHAVSREEEAILWRSLERIPEIYREPLILFYREHQSIEAVATELDLSEDAVKQRLSRGRKLLQEEVQAIVENTLRRTVPSRAFSGAVLAALPAGPAATAGAGMASKGAAAAKSGFLGTWLAPFLGIVGGITAHWLVVRAAPSARERRLKKIVFIGMWLFVLTWCIPGSIGMSALSKHLAWSDVVYFRVMACFWWFYAMALATLGVLMFRRVVTIRRESEESGAQLQPVRNPLKAGAGIALVVGVHLAYFSWLIDFALRAHDRAAAGVIAGVMAALVVWNVVQFRNKTGTAAARAVARHQALIWATILMILNGRLGTWVSSLKNIEPAELHRLLPMWIVPMLTLALAGWVYVLVNITGRKGLIQPSPA